LPVVWANWFTSESARRRINPPWLMPHKHRPAKLYEELFYTALGRFRDEKGLGLRKQRFRFKNKLLSLDSTTISPSSSAFS